MARCRPLLLAVDGLASYVIAFQRAFRSPLPRQGPGHSASAKTTIRSGSLNVIGCDLSGLIITP